MNAGRLLVECLKGWRPSPTRWRLFVQDKPLPPPDLNIIFLLHQESQRLFSGYLSLLHSDLAQDANLILKSLSLPKTWNMSEIGSLIILFWVERTFSIDFPTYSGKDVLKSSRQYKSKTSQTLLPYHKVLVQLVWSVSNLKNVLFFTPFITLELSVPSAWLCFVVFQYINKHPLLSVFNAVQCFTQSEEIGRCLSSSPWWFVLEGACWLLFRLHPSVIQRRSSTVLRKVYQNVFLH